VELDAGFDAAEERLAAVAGGLAGVEVEGAAAAGEGLRQGRAVAVDLPTRELEAVSGEFQAPAPAIELAMIHHRPGQGDGGAAGETRGNEYMPTALPLLHPGTALLTVARLEVIRAGNLAAAELDEHAVHVNSSLWASSPQRGGFGAFRGVLGVWNAMFGVWKGLFALKDRCV